MSHRKVGTVMKKNYRRNTWCQNGRPKRHCAGHVQPSVSALW
eukprot:jgi/Antlo1/76/1269